MRKKLDEFPIEISLIKIKLCYEKGDKVFMIKL